MKYLKRIPAGLMALLILLNGCPASAGALARFLNRKTQSNVTVMVYFDGSDLEENDGSATADINEILYANADANVNIILCTGGAKEWHNSVIDQDTNEYYRVKNGQLERVKDAGLKNMTDPDTLAEFVSFCAENYPAERNFLIMWDHGGGSLYGFGVDERFPGFHMMSVSEMCDALDSTGIHFDFVGFDACLMATAETAVGLAGCADYLIASEETEPDTGWYYTGWLSRLSQEPDIDTETLGRYIIDEFMKKSLEIDPHDTLTLSMIDLDRFQDATLPCLWTFAADASQLIDDGRFAAISHARNGSRSFGEDEYDQIDLLDFASHVGTDSAAALIESLTDAIVYSRATRNMEGASGMAIYFPFKQTDELNSMMKTYGSLGWDARYLSLIASFASLQMAGHQAGADEDTERDWYDAEYVNEQSSFLIENQFDSEELCIDLKNDEYYALSLSPEAWDLIVDIQLQAYLDDGEGYIELGSDDTFVFDEDDDLMVDFDYTWVSLNGQTVAYYAEDYIEYGDYYYYEGYVPIEFKGRDAHLILAWDSEHEGGYVRGVRYPSKHGAFSRQLVRLHNGDSFRPLCDYYDYDGEFIDTFYFGDAIKVKGEISVTYEEVGCDETAFCYMLTDIYGNNYWTEYVYTY
ncbi:MAG: hypothetical protein IKO07_07520 [Clostridia bacterium]|nr:hypothetical protein [Clostridia bacterium]